MQTKFIKFGLQFTIYAASLTMFCFIAHADQPYFKQAILENTTLLTKTSHTSDGSDRAKNGIPRFVGSLGANATTYKGYQYAIFYTAKDRGGYGDLFAEVQIARRKLNDAVWQYSTLPVYRLTSDDAHNRASIAISKGDGVIHVAFDHHNTPRINYAHTAIGVADNPSQHEWNDTVFNFERNMGFEKDAIGRVTYPTFHPLPGGNLLMYFRTGGSTQGAMTLAKYNAAKSEWESIRKISSRAGHYANTVTTNKAPSFRGPYTTGGPKIDENGRIHISWLFREKPINCNIGGSGGGRDCNHGLYFAYSDDEGVTWYNNDGLLIANTQQSQAISIETAGIQVADISTLLRPSNVALNSVIDSETGDYYAFVEHIDEQSGTSLLHRYKRTVDAQWHSEAYDLSSPNVSLRIIGDHMFAFAGRTEANIYYSTRDSNFSKWQTIALPKVLDEVAISRGYISWDLSMLESGRVSVLWHQEPEGAQYGMPSAIHTFDFNIGSED
ncbi:BNR-4 repeat-containing protein [Ningiella sp. W23]|uniref:BNR-4 repeat-containing protein n=1 Tax=Ningiella sp. W23 TaxID=3023715 RepID=UPI003756CE0A